LICVECEKVLEEVYEAVFYEGGVETMRIHICLGCYEKKSAQTQHYEGAD
jgi:hypothetical protein